MGKKSSNKHRQRQKGIAIPKKWVPMIIVLIVVLIGVGSIIAISGASVPEAPKVTGAPAIEVAQTSYDLGDMRFNQMARVTYKIKNVGDEPLKILHYPNVQVLEGC